MKNKYIFIFLLCNILFAQSLSNLSNTQINLIKDQLKESSNDIKQDSQEVVVNDISTALIPSPSAAPVPTEFFGYNYFKKDISFFDNIPTPADYKLGPGDEITISLWGENNSRENFTINKDGMIFYPNVGFINLSNKTLQSAELALEEELSRIYSTLKDKNNSTNLMVELGKLKSINIYFSGNIINPGINIVHPFSDIFSAIVQAGGIKVDGSLRTVQLIRKGVMISTVDFYSFFMDGKNNFSNIKLIDGDVIHIPNIKKRISISGEVIRPLSYELLSNETFTDLLQYASGLKSNASSNIIVSQIIPIEERISDDNARSSIATNFKKIESIILNNGDSVSIEPITAVELNVTVFGQVKKPGNYPANNMSLKQILDIAGGFDDPIFRQTIREDEIIILRKDENQFFSKEISVTYKNADQFKLQVSDKIFVYEDINYSNNFTYRIEGEVNKPGTYPFNSRDITVGEALSLAGGLTELTSERNLTIKQELTSLDSEGNEFTTSEPVNNVTLDFKIGINSVIIASPLENVINIEGNVYNPGLITYSKGYRYPRYIELAGGYKPDTLKREVYIKRANGNIEKVNGYFMSRGKKVYPGDTIVVPVNTEPRDFDITAFISDLSTTLANIAAILLIVDNQNN